MILGTNQLRRHGGDGFAPGSEGFPAARHAPSYSRHRQLYIIVIRTFAM
jgi:hypothetical protein